MDDILYIRLGTQTSSLDLAMVEQLGEHLRGAFRELAREAGTQGKIGVRFHIRDARKGSVALDLEPEIVGEGAPDVSKITETLIADIESLAVESPRPTMGTGLLQQYRALVAVAQKAGGLQVRHRSGETSISPERELAFRAILSERPEVDSVLAGTIETVNIHARPWKFGLYTKSDRERVECHFPDEMLQAVLELMERKVLVEVKGEAQYGPVGVTPRSLLVQSPPSELRFDPAILLSFRRSATMAQGGEGAAEAVARVREERAPFG